MGTLEAKLAKEQRILSGREKGSANWKEQRIRVARVHEQIANARAVVLHKTTTMIVKNHDIIGIEDLRIGNLLKNANRSRAISEVSWRMFRTMLEYKADWYGKQVVVIAKNVASSQLCSSCGHTNKAVESLSVREWNGPACGSFHDSALNASINLKNEAIRRLTVGTTGVA